MPEISIAAIDQITPARHETEEEAGALYYSLQELGLLQPIVVVPNPDFPVRYTVIAGRRRLNQARRLGWAKIACTVRTLDTVQVEMVEISENIHRVNLTPAERDRAIHRYAELYASLHPELKDAARVRKEANLVQKRERVKEAETKVHEARKIAPRLNQALAQQFPGTSEETIRRARTRAAAFDNQERSVLDNAKLTQTTIDKIARQPERETILEIIKIVEKDDLSAGRIDQIVSLSSSKQVSQALNLFAAGMPFPDVMREIDPHWKEDESLEEALSDENYLDLNKNRDRFDPERYRADALLYRRIAKARVEFARAIGWGNLQKKVGVSKGAYWNRMQRFLSASHPKTWIVCTCDRGSTGKQHGDCPNCKGGGFLIG